MQIANFQLPTKRDGFKSPLKTRIKIANKSGYRSHSSNVNATNRSTVQVFKGNEPNMPLQQENGKFNKKQEFNSGTGNNIGNNSTIYSQNGYPNHNSNTNTNIVQSNISLYQMNQFPIGSQIQTYYTNPKPINNGRGNPSEKYYRANSFTELNKYRDYGGIRRQDTNDNVSVHSKVSTTSRNQLLRPVSINNEDHLFNLANKEERLTNANTELINTFTKNINTTKYNVVTNMSQNFKQRINEIWTSYLSEQQKNQNNKINIQDLDNDINKITTHFQENLTAKTQNYIEGLKEKIYNDIYDSVAQKNNIKHYLDNEVKHLMENDFSSLQSKNQSLRQEVEEIKIRYKAQIEQTAQKYEQLRENHLDVYDREFCFKLNGDDRLIRDTLASAIPVLQAKNRKLDEKLNYIHSRHDGKFINQLKTEIAALEAKLRI